MSGAAWAVVEAADVHPTHLKNSYASEFYLADKAFQSGRLEATTRSRQKYWNLWESYNTGPLGVDPYLQDEDFTT